MAKKKRTKKQSHADETGRVVAGPILSFESPESSTIAGAFYDHGIMVVLFKRGPGRDNDRYDYRDVPEVIWQEFVAAGSKGAFFTQQIRPHYQGRKHGE